MTWGIQNSEEEAHEQLDFAVKERGINFIDTAELYPVPPAGPRWVPGTTEEYIGTWLAKNPELRPELVLATKVVGYHPKSKVAAVRSGPVPDGGSADMPDGRLDKASVVAACDASLRRLQTECVDLYQVHWPERYTPIFGDTVYQQERERPQSVPIVETAEAIKSLLDAGKIRAYGISNETTYGVGEWVRAADGLGMPRPVAIQNAFSLVVRDFESQLEEACTASHFNMGLMAYSVLAGGLLSGKYRQGQPDPAPSSRFVQFQGYMSRWSPQGAIPELLQAVDDYAAIAADAGMSLTELAIRWCRTRACCQRGAVIIGATTLSQLREDVDAFNGAAELPDDIMAKIDAVQVRLRNPGTVL